MSKPEHSLSLDIDATLACTDENSLERAPTFESLELFTNPTRAHLRSRVYLLDMIDVTSEAGTGRRTKMWGVFRPYTKEFMQFCTTHLKHTLIFSAGRPKYVKAMSEVLFMDTEIPPSVIFDSEKCDIGKYHVHKRLSDIISDPSLCGEVDEKSIFHIDDREDTFSLNVGNGIVIPAYAPKLTGTPEEVIEEILKPDVALLQLMCWLSLPEVVNCEDVRTLDKSTIFTTSVEEYLQRLESSDDVEPSQD